jgi:4-diphosphocytidyl-2-C-methyl-D-erythritol kinase
MNDRNSSRVYPAPAKLNLCLKVLGRSEDGYHQLQTVFQFLDIHDNLSFDINDTGQIGLSYGASAVNSDLENEVPNAENLVVKAANLLKNYALSQGVSNDKILKQGVNIVLDKVLPVGGGIGGGSSNAATTLIVLNKLWQLNVSEQQLVSLGLQLGADVPVFIKGKTAFAEGRGEQLQVIEVPEYWFVLIKPNCHVSTAQIFQHQELTRDSSPRTIRAFLAEGHGFQGLEQLIQIGNDCEKLVRKMYPKIDMAIESLSEFSQAQLTGTGACVFAPFETQASANEALLAIKNNPANVQWFETGQVAKGVNESPLHKLINTEF